IPLVRFERAAREGNSVFRPLTIPEPYTSLKDIFCLQEERIVNGYSNVVWNRRFLNIPRSIPVGARVTLHIVPDSSRPEIRVWYKEALVASMLLRPTA